MLQRVQSLLKIKNLKNLKKRDNLKARAREEEAEKLVSQTRKRRRKPCWRKPETIVKRPRRKPCSASFPKTLEKDQVHWQEKREWEEPAPSCSLFVPFPNTITWSQARYRSCRASPTYPKADKPGVRQQEGIIGHRQRYVKGKGRCAIFVSGSLPRKGVLSMLQQIFTLIVAPTIVGIAVRLFFRWLDGKDDN